MRPILERSDLLPEPTPASDSLRVLQLCAVDFTAAKFLAPLARRLARDGHEVSLACRPGAHWQGLQEAGLALEPVRMSRSWNPLALAWAVAALVVLLRRRRIEVLHVHTPAAALAGRVAAFLARTPVVVHTVHGFYFHEGARRSVARLHRLLEKALAALQDHLICVSSEDAQAAEDLRLAPVERIHAIRNGVDLGRFDPARAGRGRAALRAELGIPVDAPVIVFVGRVVREKGVLDLLDAFRGLRSSHPAARLLVVGEGLSTDRDPADGELRAAAQSPDLAGAVHLAGMRPDIPELLAASDIFCLPSLREGLPVSVLEAMAMGLPVVATRIRGSREAVQDGTTGLLCAPGSPRELAGALGYLLSHPEVARKMGGAGHRRAHEAFDLAACLDAQSALYQRIARERRRAGGPR